MNVSFQKTFFKLFFHWSLFCLSFESIRTTIVGHQCVFCKRSTPSNISENCFNLTGGSIYSVNIGYVDDNIHLKEKIAWLLSLTDFHSAFMAEIEFRPPDYNSRALSALWSLLIEGVCGSIHKNRKWLSWDRENYIFAQNWLRWGL